LKKLLTEEKYKKRNLRKAESSLARAIEYKKWRRARNRLDNNVPREKRKHENLFAQRRKEFTEITAPKIFSFLKNPNEVVRFIQKLKAFHSKKKKVFVILKDVEVIDYDAIVVLLSILVKFKAAGIGFNGDYPDKEDVNRLLRESGFFDQLYKDIPPKERYKISLSKSNDSMINTHAWTNVDPVLANRIISSASELVWGEKRRCQGVQRSLLELMQNTNNHADIDRPGTSHWWLSVNKVKSENKVCFAFVDFGVGIFTSLSEKPQDNIFFDAINKLKVAFGMKNNAEGLKLILEGKLHETVTNKYYRGKGLPGIADALKRNQLSRLHIITNDVFANVSEGKYVTLNDSFDGTFVFWEIGEKNESCKNVEA
jgi:hypothetical protein